jgi:2-polyprenyl-6-methoxyphenol hydroxylase-like FAD-dependent oxidoreductase
MKTSMLISGAGIAGPSLAYWLGRAGIQATIVEHAREFRARGYVIDFMDPGFAIHERMGLHARLQNIRPQIERAELVDASVHRKARLSGDLFRVCVRS